MLVALVSLIVLLASAALAARRAVSLMGLTGTSPTLPRAIAFGTILVAWCLVSAQLPAYLAELTGWPLVRMPVIAALSAIGVLVLRCLVGDRPTGETRVPHMTPVPQLSARTGAGRGWGRVPRRMLWACVAPVVALHGFLVIDGLLRPPCGCDGLFYHLPMIVRWLRAGRLAMVPEVRFFNYPANCELWQMLFAAPRLEPLIELSLVPVGLLLALIVAGISRELGATIRGALLAALFVLVCPMIALQMYSSFVDMFGTTFTLGALYWLIQLHRPDHAPRPRLAPVLLIGLSVGLAVGTKFTFLPWAVIIAVGVLVALLRTRRQEPRASARAVTRTREAATTALVLVLAAVATGGFWPFRSLYQTGWVFYPIQFRVAGHIIGTGWTLDKVSPSKDTDDRGVLCLAYPWFEWKRAGYAYSPDNGLGPPLATFAVPGLVYLALRKRRWPRFGDRWVTAWAWVFMIAGLVMFLTIFRPAARYSLPGWAVILAACAPLLDVLVRARPRAALALVGLTLGLSAAMIALEPARILAGRIRDRDLSRARAYQMPELFDELPAGTVILNLGPGEMNYPLLGAGWGNEVIEPFTAWHRGFRRPYDQAGLDAHGVDIVYTRADLPDVFTSDVSYDVSYDDSEEPDRPATTPATRVYRIVRVGQASSLSVDRQDAGPTPTGPTATGIGP